MHVFVILLLQFGNTPMKLAAEKGNSDAVRLLMEKEADITIADKVCNKLDNLIVLGFFRVLSVSTFVFLNA